MTELVVKAQAVVFGRLSWSRVKGYNSLGMLRGVVLGLSCEGSPLI